MHEQDDAALVAQAKAGGFEAFQELVRRHERRLFGLARRLLRDQHDAEDVVQTALLSAVEHLDGFRGDSSFGTWISRITVNHALKLIRKQRTRKRAEVDLDGGDPTAIEPRTVADWRSDVVKRVEQRELRAIMDAAIDELPEHHRTVFVLRDIQGLSTQETAEALELTPSNVKIRLMRARLALREKLTSAFAQTGLAVAGGEPEVNR